MTLRVHPDEIVENSPSPLLGIHPSWARVKLAQVAEVLNGFAFKSDFFSHDDGLPLLRIRDIGRSITDIRYTGDYDAKYFVNEGDTVVGMDGDFRVARWKGPQALLNQRVCKITVREPEVYDQAFLMYVLPGYLDAINAHTSSITVKHLSSRTVEQIPLPLPPLNEQRRIVAAVEQQFSRLDAATDSIARAKRRIERLREALIARAIHGPWPVEPLSSVLVSLRNGMFVSRPTAEPPGTAIFRISAVRPLSLDVEDVRYAPLSPDDCADYLVAEGDLLFTRYSGNPEYVGACARVPYLTRPTVHPDKLIRAVIDRDKAEPAFIELACATGVTRDQIRARRKTTAGQVGIAGGQLKSVLVPVPPVNEQRRIVSEVEHCLSLVNSMRSAIEAARRRSASLRRSILERALCGELAPPDPQDEPAFDLLIRIAGQPAATMLEQRTKVIT